MSSFTPQTPEFNPFLPDSFEQLKRALFSFHNNIPKVSIGSVSAVNQSTVDVKPSIQYFDNNAGFQDYDVLHSLPVFTLFSSQHSVKLPINPGDSGLVIWVDREIYTWLSSSSSSSAPPESGTSHNVNNAIFIPCITKFSNVTLKNSGMEFLSAGIQLLGELISLATKLSTFANSLVSAGTVPPYTWTPGAGGSAVSPTYQTQVTSAANQMLTDMTQSKNNFTTFKGQQ